MTAAIIVICQLSIVNCPFIFGFFCLCLFAYAQQDSTLNRTVVVENEYNPNIIGCLKD